MKHLQNDSREIKAGDIFLAYPGEATDGRRFISDAISAGASQIFYEPEESDAFQLEALKTQIPLVAYPNLSRELARLAAKYYEVPHHAFHISGVTGTNGKTSIAYQLAQAHDLLGNAAAYMGTLGAGVLDAIQTLQNTTPDALCVQKFLYDWSKHAVQQVAMEVSSHGLDQGRVDGVAFTQAIYTNLSHEHLDYHKTVEAYAEAKSKLFAYKSLKSVILNQDDDYVDLMRSKVVSGTQVLTYGLEKPADISAKQIQLHMNGSVFEVDSPIGCFECVIQSLGRFNIYNSLALIGSLIADGYAIPEIQSVMPKLKASPGRMEQVSSRPAVLVDYAHTPDALEKALATLAALKQSKLIVVFGCGGDRDKYKRPLMGKIAEKYADQIILTSDNPRMENPSAILEDIATGLSPDANVMLLENRKAAIQKALEIADDDDMVLIAGKGHESYQDIQGERFLFSDAAVVKELLG